MSLAVENRSIQIKNTSPTLVPFLDLPQQARDLRAEVLEVVDEVLSGASYVLGPKVADFERKFAAYIGSKHCVGVNSGTSALHLALIAAGVGPGDEVITVPMTFVATCWAISYVGATPVFVDVDPNTYTMNPAHVTNKITGRTKAILPVHLYGQPADLGALSEISRRFGVPLIEDAAQAHGAKYCGRNAGTFGMCGCFSFYPGKNLGAFGEGGAVVTDDDAIAARLRSLRDHAQEKRYHHAEIGFNYRMDGIQGAVLGLKLKYLEEWTEARRTLSQRYQHLLANLDLQAPIEAVDRRHVWHLFVVLHTERERIRSLFESRGIQTGLHYPVPVHLQPAYRHLCHNPGSFPVAERIARECLSLPIFPEMTIEQQDAVLDVLGEILGEVS